MGRRSKAKVSAVARPPKLPGMGKPNALAKAMKGPPMKVGKGKGCG